MDHLNLAAAAGADKFGLPGITGNLDVKQLTGHAERLWQFLDELAANDPDGYKDFLGQQAKAAGVQSAKEKQSAQPQIDGVPALVLHSHIKPKPKSSVRKKCIISFWANSEGEDIEPAQVDGAKLTSQTRSWSWVHVPMRLRRPQFTAGGKGDEHTVFELLVHSDALDLVVKGQPKELSGVLAHAALQFLQKTCGVEVETEGCRVKVLTADAWRNRSTSATPTPSSKAPNHAPMTPSAKASAIDPFKAAEGTSLQDLPRSLLQELSSLASSDGTPKPSSTQSQQKQQLFKQSQLQEQLSEQPQPWNARTLATPQTAGNAHGRLETRQGKAQDTNGISGGRLGGIPAGRSLDARAKLGVGRESFGERCEGEGASDQSGDDIIARTLAGGAGVGKQGPRRPLIEVLREDDACSDSDDGKERHSNSDDERCDFNEDHVHNGAVFHDGCDDVRTDSSIQNRQHKNDGTEMKRAGFSNGAVDRLAGSGPKSFGDVHAASDRYSDVHQQRDSSPGHKSISSFHKSAPAAEKYSTSGFIRMSAGVGSASRSSGQAEPECKPFIEQLPEPEDSSDGATRDIGSVIRIPGSDGGKTQGAPGSLRPLIQELGPNSPAKSNRLVGTGPCSLKCSPAGVKPLKAGFFNRKPKQTRKPTATASSHKAEASSGVVQDRNNVDRSDADRICGNVDRHAGGSVSSDAITQDSGLITVPLGGSYGKNASSFKSSSNANKHGSSDVGTGVSSSHDSTNVSPGGSNSYGSSNVSTGVINSHGSSDVSTGGSNSHGSSNVSTGVCNSHGSSTVNTAGSSSHGSSDVITGGSNSHGSSNVSTGVCNSHGSSTVNTGGSSSHGDSNISTGGSNDELRAFEKAKLAKQMPHAESSSAGGTAFEKVGGQEAGCWPTTQGCCVAVSGVQEKQQPCSIPYQLEVLEEGANSCIHITVQLPGVQRASEAELDVIGPKVLRLRAAANNSSNSQQADEVDIPLPFDVDVGNVSAKFIRKAHTLHVYLTAAAGV